jgi:hypothetical protein
VTRKQAEKISDRLFLAAMAIDDRDAEGEASDEEMAALTILLDAHDALAALTDRWGKN